VGEPSARRQRVARRRALGQNFLADPALAGRIVRDAQVGRSDHVVEVGAGGGVFTAALARRAASVLAVELDPVWAERLRRRFDGSRRVRVVEGDALELELPARPFRVVANVPFGISMGLLHRLLDDPASSLQRADLLLQWDAARKRAARSRSIAGATWSPWWRFRLGARIPRTAFRPMPSVDGGMLVVERRPRPLLPVAAATDYGAFVHGLYGGTLAPELLPEQWAALFAAYEST
jgi:23S rRNA (adenine-N6)-dimethyltransferase